MLLHEKRIFCINISLATGTDSIRFSCIIRDISVCCVCSLVVDVVLVRCAVFLKKKRDALYLRLFYTKTNQRKREWVRCSVRSVSFWLHWMFS